MLSDTLGFIKVDLIIWEGSVKSKLNFPFNGKFIGGGKGRTDGSAAFSGKGRSPNVHQTECAEQMPFLYFPLYSSLAQITRKNYANIKSLIFDRRNEKDRLNEPALL